jgi:hypothetical protein
MHAMFERRGEEVWVVDLQSRNGTFVGEERVTEARLTEGAVLRFGRTEVHFALQPTWSGGEDDAPRGDRSRPDGQRDTIRAQGTLSTRAPAVHEPEPDPYALALRPLVVLRMSLHAIGVAGAPDAAARIRAAVEAGSRAVLDEGGVAGRIASIGVLGLFGVTGAAPDDAARAVRAARAARAAIRRLGGIDVRAAVDAGPLLAGDAGGPAGAEIAAMGAAADRCERLAALAHPGEIIIGPGAAGAADAPDVRKRELDGVSVEIVGEE